MNNLIEQQIKNWNNAKEKNKKDKNCFNCKWLYIKDFITGVCEKTNKIVQPDQTCENHTLEVKEKNQ